MASLKMQPLLAVILTSLLVFQAAMVLATEFIVGDDSGWSINVNYEAWADGKTFYVGDTLVFNYPQGYHTVVKVNGTGFAQCIKSPNSGVLATGSDRITLSSPGNKWYICGVGDHCSYYQQKLKITVASKQAPVYMPPSPAPSGSPVPAPWFSPAVTGHERTYMSPVPAPWAAPSPMPASWSPSMPAVPAAPMEPPSGGWEAVPDSPVTEWTSPPSLAPSPMPSWLPPPPSWMPWTPATSPMPAAPSYEAPAPSW